MKTLYQNTLHRQHSQTDNNAYLQKPLETPSNPRSCTPATQKLYATPTQQIRTQSQTKAHLKNTPYFKQDHKQNG